MIELIGKKSLISDHMAVLNMIKQAITNGALIPFLRAVPHQLTERLHARLFQQMRHAPTVDHRLVTFRTNLKLGCLPRRTAGAAQALLPAPPIGNGDQLVTPRALGRKQQIA